MSSQSIQAAEPSPLSPGVRLAVLTLALCTLFGALGLLARSGDTLALDQQIMLAVHLWTSPGLTLAMQLLTDMGSGVVVGPLIAIEIIVLWRHREAFKAFILLLAVGSEPLAQHAVAGLFARPRPELWPHLANASGFSYPSGHTSLATVAYGFSAVVLVPRLHHPLARAGVVVATAGLILLVAVSRVYLGVHYPSDVLGGVLFGSAWISLWSIVLIRQRGRSDAQPPAGRSRSASPQWFDR